MYIYIYIQNYIQYTTPKAIESSHIRFNQPRFKHNIYRCKGSTAELEADS